VITDVRVRQALQHALAVLWLGSAWGSWSAVDLVGFPDGHRTELDQARLWAWPMMIGLSVLGATVTVFLPHRHLARAFWVFVVAQLVFFGADAVLAAMYNGGGGG
jgi:hypothetical protein